MFSRRILCFLKFQKLSDLQKPILINQCNSKSLNRTATTVNEDFKKSEPDNLKNQEHLQTSPRKNFKVFYRLPHITIIRLFSRLKIYQTGLTLILIPWTIYLQHQGMVDPSTVFFSISLSSFATLMLFIVSQVCQRFVGLAAFDARNDTVRLSHLTFWGHRNDVYVSLEDLIPPLDIGENSSDVFFKVKKYSDARFLLFLSKRHGIVEDQRVYEDIFGAK